MNPKLDTPQRPLPQGSARPGFENVVLRLIKGAPERLAIEAGQVDAIIDTASGTAILLPEAQRALIERKTRFRSLVALCSDWHWQQDEHHRFAARESAGAGKPGIDDATIIGKTLWEMPFDNMSEADWQTHRNQLEWRATFNDLELRYVDRAGEVRYISVDGEPIFDEQDEFRGYRGTARDITGRKRTEVLLQGPDRHARSALDALAAQICVLDPAGTVIMANTAWCACAVNSGIGTGVLEGDNFLAVCDGAAGNERTAGGAIAAGIRKVIAGERELFRHEYATDTPGGPVWIVLTVTGYRADSAARAVVSRETIAGRKRAEPLLELDYTVANQAPDASRQISRRISIANSLLAALPDAEYQRLLSGLEPVTLTYGDVLYAPGAPIRHVYFPIDSLVSLLTTVDNRRHALEVGLIGHEGMVGISLALGISVSPVRALVQGTGTAMRMEAAPFCKELLQSMPLQRMLYRYTHALMAQFAQTAACNNFHSVEARLARWLLMTRDRLLSNEFRLTHQLLAEMLGIRRGGVTTAAGALQKRKLISYSRGNIRILDRKSLEAAACRCYRIIKNLQGSKPAWPEAVSGRP